MSNLEQDNADHSQIATFWGSGWQKLTAKQKHLVSEIMNHAKIASFSALEDRVYQMPFPDFVEVSEQSNAACIFEQQNCDRHAVISWQNLLEHVSKALITGESKDLLWLLFLELDYVRLNKNAIIDVYAITKQEFDIKSLRELDFQIHSIQELFKKYIQHPSENSQTRLIRLINEFNVLIEQIKNLEVVGIGAFALAASLQLLLFQEKAQFNSTEWINLKNQAIDYYCYAQKVNPKLYRLTVGKIDKICHCTTCKFRDEKKLTEYECRYFDGKDVHVFRGISNQVGYECNKHRLKMFQSVVETVNQTVSTPLRLAIKKWQEVAKAKG